MSVAPESLGLSDQDRGLSVSIIIPAYNAAATIADTLNSVIAQVSPTWEAIVIDDGSADATATIARAFANRDPRIRVITQANGGEAAARNTGISHARYDWLLFLDADDWISPSHLQRLTSELESHPEFDAVHCGSVRVALDGSQVADQYMPPAGDMFPTLARRAAFPIHACIVRRSLVEQVGRFDTSIRKSPDWDLWQRVARTGARFGAVRDVLAYYRIQPNSASMDARRLFEDGLRVLQRGHAADPRVANPHPAHARGAPPEEMIGQQFYLLCWCAGLMIGAGKSATSLLESIRDARYSELYPNAIAQCIFDAAPLPTGRTSEAWEALWPTVRHNVEEFLPALEGHSRTPGLAAQALAALKKMILLSSATWRPVLEAAEHAATERQALIDQLERDRTALETKCEHHLQRLEELKRELRQGEERCESVAAELRHTREHAESLRRERNALERDLVRWRRIAEEHERLVKELESQRWVRLGKRVGALKGPAQPSPLADE